MNGFCEFFLKSKSTLDASLRRNEPSKIFVTFCRVSKNLQIKLCHLLTYMDVWQLIRIRIKGLICEKMVKMSKIVNFFHFASGVYEKSRTSRCAREL